MGRYMFSIVLLLLSLYGQSQQAQSYPQQYFRLPLSIPPSLAGNFGDLRTNHYHMGLDLRTQQRENLTVVAAADGYVSHIRVEPYGYGRAIYITHLNGYTTVYAHLNTFYPELEDYTRKQQYASQSWEQNIDFLPFQFTVRKGQMIALSGNTGGSQGPHLHFEIREAGLANGQNLNPLLFGLGISDHVPPVLYRVGVFNRNSSIYESRPQLFSLVKKGTRTYATSQPVLKVPSGKFSLALGMQDKMDNSFSFGVYSAEMYVDDRLTSRFTIDKCVYEDSRYINAAIDYVTKYSGGAYMQHLSKLPGDRAPFFDSVAGNGVLQLTDDAVHRVEIKVSDAAGNTSVAAFGIQREPSVAFSSVFGGKQPAAKLLPNVVSTFDTTNVKVVLGEKTLYDTVLLRYSVAAAPAQSVSALHTIGDYRLPVHSYISVAIQPSEVLADSIKRKTVMMMRSGKKSDAQRCSWQNNFAEAQWRNFGEFYLKYDDVAPTIRPVNVREGASFSSDRHLVIDAKDETSDLLSFNGFIDGKWVIFRQKNDRYTYDFDDNCPRGWHSLEVKAIDFAGNESVYRCSFQNVAGK